VYRSKLVPQEDIRSRTHAQLSSSLRARLTHTVTRGLPSTATFREEPEPRNTAALGAANKAAMLDRPGLSPEYVHARPPIQNGMKAQAIEAYGARGRPLELAASGSASRQPRTLCHERDLQPRSLTGPPPAP